MLAARTLSGRLRRGRPSRQLECIWIFIGTQKRDDDNVLLEGEKAEEEEWLVRASALEAAMAPPPSPSPSPSPSSSPS